MSGFSCDCGLPRHGAGRCSPQSTPTCRSFFRLCFWGHSSTKMPHYRPFLQINLRRVTPKLTRLASETKVCLGFWIESKRPLVWKHERDGRFSLQVSVGADRPNIAHRKRAGLLRLSSRFQRSLLPQSDRQAQSKADRERITAAGAPPTDCQDALHGTAPFLPLPLALDRHGGSDFLTRCLFSLSFRYQICPPVFIYLQCHVLQNFIGRQDPIHRNRMAALCWTTKAQWSVSACAASYLDLPASNNFAANEAVPFLIQRTPRSELIEPLQRLEFISVGQFNRRRQHHRMTMWPPDGVAQSGAR